MDTCDDAAKAVEAHVLPRAARQTVPQFARSVQRAVQRFAPQSVAELQASARSERRVLLRHDGAGWSRLITEGPTHDVFRIHAAIDAVARTLDDKSATLEQRRLDALTSMADTILDDAALAKTRFGAPGLVLLADIGTLARLRSED